MFSILFINIFVILSINTNAEIHNTYLIHGVGSTPEQVSLLEIALKEQDIPIYNLGLIGDPLKSIFTLLDKQCDLYYEEIIRTLQVIKNTNTNITTNISTTININKTITTNSNLPLINIIGISQGGLIARCLVERYNNISYLVKNIITIASPNMGVYYINSTQPEWIYTMEEITFSEYWKDPYTYDLYLESNKFLSRLNNEVEHNEYNIFKNNFISINKLILIWSNIDEVIQPQQSSIFNYWDIKKAEKDNQLVMEIVNKTEWYLKDYLGFNYLKKKKVILEYMFPCIHDEFKLPICFANSSITVNDKTLLDTLIEFII